MTDFIGNSVRSFVKRFGLHWCKQNNNLKHALYALYGKERQDINVIINMLEEGMVDSLEELNSIEEYEKYVTWLQDKKNISEQMAKWAVHTWTKAIFDRSFLKEASPPPSYVSFPYLYSKSYMKKYSSTNSQKDYSNHAEQRILTTPLQQSKEQTLSTYLPVDTRRSVWRPKKLLLLVIACMIVILLYACFMSLFSDSQTEVKVSEAEKPSKQDWIDWLEDIKSGENENRLVIPGCESLEKGGNVQHLLTKYGYSDTQSVIEDRFYYRFDTCTYYEKDNKNTGNIFSVERQAEDWQPSREEIEEQLGDPNDLMINESKREARTLYHFPAHDLLFIYQGVENTSSLKNVEMGEINKNAAALEPEHEASAVQTNLPQPHKDRNLKNISGQPGRNNHLTESARMFLEELVLSVKEWGGYAPGCTMLEADLNAESLVGLLGPPDAEQKIGEMQRYTYGECEFYFLSTDRTKSIKAISSTDINKTISEGEVRHFLGEPVSDFSDPQSSIFIYTIGDYFIQFEFNQKKKVLEKVTLSDEQLSQLL
ncbi:DUF4309 domain-containing protein [Alteribacillus sp. YIM 98480]|uniref:DUF4309 domain-containing protein n=1 Tax=Alteribacillus sp. YIM 98480 TaxID=2606599 RepID=UPI00131A9B94|nr:DUF4309 domain-containing protein [Alteribacillus sp. YIM 98480]